MNANTDFLSYLLPLWRIWKLEEPGTALDKWLSHHWKQSKHPRSKSPLADISSATRFQLGQALQQSQMYLQLACGLEESYNQQALLDWSTWDKTWEPHKAFHLRDDVFWFWVLRRVDPELAKHWRVKDQEARFEWFETCEKSFNEKPSSEQLLWFGLRPQWSKWLDERAEKSAWSSEQYSRFIELQNSRPPLWLRANTEQLDELVVRLTKESVDVQREGNKLCVTGGAFLAKTQVYAEGLIEIQDAASQLISDAVQVNAGQKVWDACAGAGGKTLAIAQRLNNTGSVLATDLHQYKLDELKRRAKRAQAYNVRSFIWGGQEPLALPHDVKKQGGFDWVLVDAPCSSSGTWRRNPDARWRFSEKDTNELKQLQTQLLNNVAPAVKQGGHLVYATCSWQVSENEQQIANFLESHQDFICVSQSQVGAPWLNSDTMFVAVLKRNPV